MSFLEAVTVFPAFDMLFDRATLLVSICSCSGENWKGNLLTRSGLVVQSLQQSSSIKQSYTDHKRNVRKNT